MLRLQIMNETKIKMIDGADIYNFWRIFKKRKKIILSILILPSFVLFLVIMSLPVHFRGESEITIPLSEISKIVKPANIERIIAGLDNAKREKIFSNIKGAVIDVKASASTKSSDKVNIIIESETQENLPQAFKDILNYLSTVPELQNEISRIKEEKDLKLKKLLASKKANLIFIDQIQNMIKQRQLNSITINPADLIEKDGQLSIEIFNLQHSEIVLGKLGPLSIIKKPSGGQIRKMIVITAILSIMASILFIFFIEHVERMRAGGNKSSASTEIPGF